MYIDVYVDGSSALTGNKFNIFVNVWNMRGNLIEECNITINNQHELTDHQNGSYSSGEVIIYDRAGEYNLTFIIEHEIYLNLMVSYNVIINDLFNLDKLKSIEAQTVWFANKLTLLVPVFNETDDTFIKNCNVSLYTLDGDLMFTLDENDDGEFYEGDLDHSNWLLSDVTYSVIIEKENFRTEILTIHAVILPFGFLFIVFDIIVLSTIFSVILYRKYGSKYGRLLVEKIKNRIGNRRTVDIEEKPTDISEKDHISTQDDSKEGSGDNSVENRLP